MPSPDSGRTEAASSRRTARRWCAAGASLSLLLAAGIGTLGSDHPPSPGGVDGMVQSTAKVLVNPLVPGVTAADARNSQVATGSPGDGYTPLAPQRLLDTRTSGTPLETGASLALTVADTATVPGTATAVTLNLTVTGSAGAGYLAVYPTGGPPPLVSNLNWTGGETVANLVIVPVGTQGQVSIFDGGAPTFVIVDLEGYFAPWSSGSTQGSYVPLAPNRLVDTRPGSGYLDAGQTLQPGASLTVPVAGEGGVPPQGAVAVVANVTVTDTSAAGFLTVYPAGLTPPPTSNLNWEAGQTVANRVIVPLGANGAITLANRTGSADAIVDLDGYFTDAAAAGASLFTPIAPVRVLDTRQAAGPLEAATTITQALAGVDGVALDASAVVANLTATDTTSASFFTAYPQGQRPNSSDLNWTAGQTVANLDLLTLSPSGATSIYNSSGAADLIIDVFGYFTPLHPPLRIMTSQLAAAVVGVAYTASLEAIGGAPPYTWAVTSGSLPQGLELSPAGTVTGIPTDAQSTSFSVRVTDSTAPTPLTATGQISLDVLISVPTTYYSANWSGYAVGTGPFTEVSGTFNVPAIGPEPVSTDVSEWVGVDGITNSSLIQAGVNEEYSNSGNQIQINAWWEVLPAASTTITTLDISPGDSVTVSLDQVNASTWAITVTDNSTGQSFTTDQPYSGPQSSAEWIVEAPLVNGQEAILSPFYPQVTFSSLSTAGPVNSADLFAMVQNGSQVATPSAADASGVAVAYGDVAPPSP